MEIVRNLNDTTVSSVKTFLESNIDTTQDVSNYAKGRERGWLMHDCPLAMQGFFAPSPSPKKLWDWLNQVWTESGMPGTPDSGLACFGAIGIDMHRDATYAAKDSLLINLGGVSWCYEPSRNDASESTWEHTELDQGEIAQFNCKHRHAAYKPLADRWSIVLWQISHTRRAEYEAYLRGDREGVAHARKAYQAKYPRYPIPLYPKGHKA